MVTQICGKFKVVRFKQRVLEHLECGGRNRPGRHCTCAKLANISTKGDVSLQVTTNSKLLNITTVQPIGHLQSTSCRIVDILEN